MVHIANTDYSNIESALKFSLTGFSCALLSYFEPVYELWIALIIVFFSDIFIGIVCGLSINHETFSIKKFANAWILLLVFMIADGMTYIIGHLMDVKPQAFFGMKMITWGFLYFYCKNIIKNLRLIFPDSMQIRFLEYLINIEFVKKISVLDNFLKTTKNETDENKDK